MPGVKRASKFLASSAALVLASLGVVSAWTAPVSLSPFGPESTRARISRGSGGAMHIVWVDKSNWDIYYRYRAANGAWGPMEPIAVGPAFAAACNVMEDPAGRANVWYTGAGLGGTTDIYQSVKIGGSWTTSAMFASAEFNEDYATARADALGNIHLIYFKSASSSTGDYGTVVYRMWNGSSWSGETVLGSLNTKAYYHRPDMSVDSANNVHVFWAQDAYTLVYRKKSSGTWQPLRTVGTTSIYAGRPTISAATPSSIIVAFDGDSAVRWAHSADGGNTWSAIQVLDGGADPKTDNDLLGRAHIVYMASPATTIKYRMWNGSSWSAAETISPATRWQGWPDVGVSTTGVVYAVYGDGDVWAQDVVKFVASVDTDTAPPGQVTNFNASAGDGKVYLSWTNPSDPDYAATIIRCRTDGYPTGPNDGTLVYNGTGTSFTHDGLTNGVRYYYSAFTRDYRPNYSAAVQAHATPVSMTCAYVRTLSDGSAVDLRNVVVSAVFSIDGAIYVQDASRAAGIRVTHPGTGVAVGDRVNVTGTMSTRTINNLPSERQITIGLVTKLSSGAPPKPLAMITRAVGGGPSGPLVPGVRDGVGINNIGLLVTISGKVTYKSGQFIFVDDGSRVQNIFGTSTPTTGVMVRCPSTSVPANVGDVVSVTGIVSGSIPTGWQTNRAFIQMRTWSDLVLVSYIPTTGRISGTVTDGSGNPISGATVSTNTGGYTTTTGSGGTYTITDVAPGTYSVTASKSGYTSQTVNNVSVTAGVTTTVNFTLNATSGTISGVVRDTQGNPLISATVSTNTGGYSTTTSSTGAYTLSNVAPGTYSVTASKSGYISQTVSNVTVTAGQTTTVNFNLSPNTGTISGTVKDNNGNGISGALVSTSAGGYSTTSGTGGSYTLSNVAAGTYSVTASKSGYTSQTVNNVTVTANQTTTVNFTLTITASERLNNGSFEGGFFYSGWWGGYCANGWGFAWKGSPAYDSFYCEGYNFGGTRGWTQKVQGKVNDFEVGIAQEVTGLTPGASYTFSADSYKAGSNYQVFLAVRPGTGYGSDMGSTVGTEFPNATGTWVSQSVSGTVGSQGAVTVYLWVKRLSGSTADVFFDNASFMSW